MFLKISQPPFTPQFYSFYLGSISVIVTSFTDSLHPESVFVLMDKSDTVLALV
jgi:hypothetical protein